MIACWEMLSASEVFIILKLSIRMLAISTPYDLKNVSCKTNMNSSCTLSKKSGALGPSVLGVSSFIFSKSITHIIGNVLLEGYSMNMFALGYLVQS